MLSVLSEWLVVHSDQNTSSSLRWCWNPPCTCHWQFTVAAAFWLLWPPAFCPSRPKAVDCRSLATGSGAKRWLAEGCTAQVSPGRTLALRSSDRWEAELVFETVEHGELVEPGWGTSCHCRHQELTQEYSLDPSCSYSSRATQGWGGICSGGSMCVWGRGLLITCGSAWENCHTRNTWWCQ